VSFYQIEDIIESAINLIGDSDISLSERRDIIYNLYRFHDEHDTSYTRFRVLDVLKSNHYLYELPITTHPDYLGNEHFFNQYNKSWIPINLLQEGKVVYTKDKKLFFEAGDSFWEIIRDQLPKADQKYPELIPMTTIFYRLLEIAKQQKNKLFIKRWYATFVSSILEEDINENERIFEEFELWLKEEYLNKIRNFAEQNVEILNVHDEDYIDDELLSLPNLKSELKLATNANQKAKIRYLLDFEVPLSVVVDDFKKDILNKPDLSSYELIYDFFREKLGNQWQDGIKEIAESEGMITFLEKLPYENGYNHNFYTNLIISYESEFNTISFRIGIQSEEILRWQNRGPSSKPELQHFIEDILFFGDAKELEKNKHISNWGAWKYDTKNSNTTLLKRLDSLWTFYGKYAKTVFDFYGSSLSEWSGINDSETLMKKRNKVLKKGFSFFGNEMEFKMYVACLNLKRGKSELTHKYANEVQSLLDRGLGSDQLKKKIQQGLIYLNKDMGGYPEITNKYSYRLKKVN
jgi:hypothetical protein